MGSDEPVVRYEVDGAVATITMNRPAAANAQNTALIDGVDATFDRADADDDVRVVILAGAGKHFSAGHDLKSLLDPERADAWVQMRETPEGKFRHEQVMYVDALPEDPRLPQAHHRRRAGQVRGRRSHAGVHVRPHRGRRRRHRSPTPSCA